MKKLIYIFLLLPFLSFGQVANGTETKANAFRSLNPQTVTASDFITTTGTDGTQGKILGENISLSVIPPVHHFTPITTSIKGYFQGVDNALGDIVATTAGITTRLWLTADQTTITAGTFYRTNFTNKGVIASAEQSVINDDNQKKYFTQDIIGDAYVAITTFPKGIYAGNLSVSASPNSAQQRFTVEVYKCNNAGTPIASGISGAVTGDLGVTVITILDSGLLTLADGSVTNVPVSNTIEFPFTINVGERVRYHISAEKVGTAASNITEKLYLGTSYNSYIDVPVPLNTSSVQNLSTVAGATTTDALNTLNAAIPVNYSKIVYVNNNNPNSATIFDDENPPIVNDNSLKSDVTNLYVGTDASGWVYNATSLNYITKSTPSASSIFYNSGTTIPANNTTSPVYRTGITGFGTSVPIATLDVLNGNISTNIVTSYFTSGGSDAKFRLGFKNGGGTTTNSEHGYLAFDYVGVGTVGKIGFNRGAGFNGDAITFGIGTVGFPEGMRLNSLGNLQVTGNVTSNAIDTNTTKITITTSTSITTSTTDANGIRQDGRHVVISNGATAINLTCNGGVTTSYGKVGSANITFIQGSGRTLVQLSGTAILNGAVGSTATLWSNGTTDYLAITNY